MDGGPAFEEGIGVGGDEGLVGKGDEEAEDEEIELEMLEAAVRRGGREWGEGVVGLGHVVS